MEKGSYVDRCVNNDEGGNVLGTLFVQLPSIYTGGKWTIFEGEDETREKHSILMKAVQHLVLTSFATTKIASMKLQRSRVGHVSF